MILVASDSFKGTFTSAEVAAAIGRGIASAGGEADLCPMADGGEGTLDVLVFALGGERIKAEAHDPLGREIPAEWAWLDDSSAVVETAAAVGLGLVAQDERDAEGASSLGAGELIVAAIAAGAERVLVAAGGSATTDGGAGAIEAIEAAGGLGGARLEVLCDVRTSFEDAPRAFGPQKGANAAVIERLEGRLDRLAASLPRDPRGVPMTGCAGGLSGGLWAAFDAELRPGAVAVMEAVGFDRRLASAAAVVSGEGRLDGQSLEGKLVGELAVRCSAAAKPLHLIVGTDALTDDERRRLGARSVAEAGTLAAIERAAAGL